MSKEYRAKVFKSGNSLALRLPKGIGLKDGDEVRIVGHANGSFSLWQSGDEKAVFMALYGSMSEGFMRGGRGDIEQAERDWSVGGDGAKAA